MATGRCSGCLRGRGSLPGRGSDLSQRPKRVTRLPRLPGAPFSGLKRPGREASAWVQDVADTPPLCGILGSYGCENESPS